VPTSDPLVSIRRLFAKNIRRGRWMLPVGHHRQEHRGFAVLAGCLMPSAEPLVGSCAT
jgi:hypothetical protein